eukprot:Trichotokara_eunicae@DN5264_c0_g1_i1.p2
MSKKLEWMEENVNVTTARNDDLVVSFCRGDLIFVFNFHPTNEYTEYKIGVTSTHRAFEILFTTEEERFGGQGRLNDIKNTTIANGGTHEDWKGSFVIPRLPSRSAMVLYTEPMGDPILSDCDAFAEQMYPKKQTENTE